MLLLQPFKSERSSGWRTLLMFLILGLGLLVIAVATVEAATALQANLSGAAEVPGPGDPDGSGHANVVLYQSQNRICYSLSASNIDPATAAHIHSGDAASTGPVVLTLNPPGATASKGCVNGVSTDLIKAIAKHPELYYVNVHNGAYPGGAIWGQLSP